MCLNKLVHLPAGLHELREITVVLIFVCLSVSSSVHLLRRNKADGVIKILSDTSEREYVHLQVLKGLRASDGACTFVCLRVYSSKMKS